MRRYTTVTRATRAFLATATLLTFWAIAGAASPAQAQIAPTGPETTQGERVLMRDCSSCHAVGRSGGSPHAEAPPFRILGQRYPIESLEEALGEGLMSGHPDMPEFKYEPRDIGAIIDYLNSIQER